jgi:VanZ family protein
MKDIDYKLRNLDVIQRLYRMIFIMGYISMLVVAFLPVAGQINRIHIGINPFKLRLDYVLHFVVYFCICLYYILGSLNDIYIFRKNCLLKYMLIVSFLAIVSEFFQLWVPSRSFNIYDFISNFSGLLVGFIVIIAFKNRTKVNRK